MPSMKLKAANTSAKVNSANPGANTAKNPSRINRMPRARIQLQV